MGGRFVEKRILHTAIWQSILLLCICLALVALNGKKHGKQHQVSVYAKSSLQDTIDSIVSNGPNYIKVKKAQKLIGNIYIDTDVLRQKVKIEYETRMPFVFYGIEQQGGDIVKRSHISYVESSGRYCAILDFVLAGVYEVKVCQDAQYIYLGFFKPSELYEKVVLIDPGHGGIDSGTLSVNPQYTEKEINLSLARKIERKLEQDKKIKVYLSREKDKYLSPEDRVKFIHALNPDICISIHCNSAGNTEASGVEVLYSKKNQDKGIRSKQLAKDCLKGILKETKQVNRGVVKGDNIYILRKAEVPIALVEIGFLSNQEEFSYLINSDYQNKIADGIIEAIRK